MLQGSFGYTIATGTVSFRLGAAARILRRAVVSGVGHGGLVAGPACPSSLQNIDLHGRL